MVGTMGGQKGRRKGPSSPTLSTHPSPSLPSASLPRLKLSLRNTPTPPLSRKNAKPRSYHSTQRSSTKHFLDDSDSDLTPPDDDETDDDHDLHLNHVDDEEDQDDSIDRVTPRMLKNQNQKDKSKPTAVLETPLGKRGGSSNKKKSIGKKERETPQEKETVGSISANISNSKNVGTTGPAGRERKRALKVEGLERRRARDAKFDIDAEGFHSLTPTRSRSGRSPQNLLDSDATSSFGDDESEPDSSLVASLHKSLAPDVQAAGDDEMAGLPEAFAGQEIEDLAYGGGLPEFEMEREVLNGWWEDDEDEDEELFIARLSGSEAEQQSQSSVHESDSDDSLESESSTSDDEVDEFGFPLPTTTASAPTAEEGPLVLMENWDGQFVLVQPRQERSRSRRRGSRGSRTAGSIGGSTVLSGTDQQGLIIDPDAVYDSSSEWSGVSDQEGGDTTDSMAEEDMPMLDSPALDQLIGEQLANVNMGVGLLVNGTSPSPPNIVVTEAIPDLTPALSTPGLHTPQPALSFPETPMAPPPLPTANGPIPPMIPVMGTFHPTSDDPAQHAVIDGSKIPTKSPFTHRRRSRRGRADSVATTTRSIETVDTKRKRSLANTPAGQHDPFIPSTLPKRARYSSIPGHPRYVAARRAAAAAMALTEREDTSEDDDDIDGIDLEDMLDGELLSAHTHHEVGDEAHGFRFDRVPVSTYLRRNLGQTQSHGREDDMVTAFSSPIANRNGAGAMSFGMGMGMMGMGMGMYPMNPLGLGMGLGMGIGEGFGLGDTLAGPPARMMLISPSLGPSTSDGNDDGVLSRKEKRKKRKLGSEISHPPPLQI